MGFEQLAGLKEQLAKQAASAAAKKKAQRARRPVPAAASKPAEPAKPAKPAAAPSKPVDPVVHVIGKLQKRFPLAFPKNPAPKVPLKVGIFEDLMKHAEELGLNEKELRGAIKVWCRGNRYWTCLVQGAPRIDLTGGAAGEVSAADAERAVYLETNRLARSAPAPKTAEAVK
ncbi:ProQ activator of osmoprotectant transporter ProP [Caballeronia novacaledonica]|uniref:ProQ activator of osmoprotectant transporter ProP n=1 Tax=Caballeronia novacaledonica TaxID=1544861 RepID=A0A2U3I0F6_9BURK|nr:ProQ/FinO family protein [Caballeronia novacaledonica]SPB13556.1 ProQ activator of osmoprotectant transporter ProP [Caballeronia novacaledonica]